MNQGVGRRGDRDSGHILKVELEDIMRTGFLRDEFKDDSKIFGLSNWKNKLPFLLIETRIDDSFFKGLKKVKSPFLQTEIWWKCQIGILLYGTDI